MTENKNASPEKRVAASYVTSFYNEVLLLTDAHSQYMNLMIEIEQMQKDGAELNENEAHVLKNSIQNLRYYVQRCYIQFIALNNKLEETELETKIKEKYDSIMAQYIIKRADSIEFVALINKFIVNEVIDELLKTSHDVVDAIYEND